MNTSKKNKAIINICIGIVSQIITLAIGIVLPRLVMLSYGSEVNGLFNSVGQIFQYMALLEAGIGNAALQELYKSISREDEKDTDVILSTCKYCFRKTTILYTLFVIALSVIYPLVTESSISKIDIGLIVLLNGLSNVLVFLFVSTIKQLFIADGRYYYIVVITLINTVLTAAAKIALIAINSSIVFIQLAYLLIGIIQVLVYLVVFKVKYPNLTLRSKIDNSRLKQRKAFLAHEVSNVVFNNTDVVLISLFCGFASVSVYSIYSLVFSSVSSLVSSIISGLNFILGQSYNRKENRYEYIQDVYESGIMILQFTAMSIAYIVIIPFIKLYTSGVNDIAYVDNWLPLLFCGVNLLSICRSAPSTLISISGHAGRTVNRAIIEMVINLGASLILVFKIGIYGVLLGTICALLYRVTDMIIYTNIKILNRKPIGSFVRTIINFLIFFTMIIIVKSIQIHANTYMDVIVLCIISGIILLPIYSIANIVMNFKKIKYIYINIIKKANR